MKIIYLRTLILLFLLPISVKADPIGNIANLLLRGNTQELSKLFSQNVEVTIMNDDSVFSKTEVNPALNKFFSQNKPLSVAVLHKITSNANYIFGVLLLTTDKGIFRVAVTLNKTGAGMKVIELRIEAEKTK